MMTPAQRRFNKVIAAKASGSDDVVLADSSAYELMLIKLASDRKRLRDIQSIERKVAAKQELLPEYDDWVMGALDAGKGEQDDVLVTVMVWNIDVGRYQLALDIAQYVLAYKLVLPDQYERTVATVLVDEIADAALIPQNRESGFDIEVLERLDQLTKDHDMPDQARAKLHKALGMQYKLSENYSKAIDEFTRALELNAKAGCKRDLDECIKLLKQGQK